ncbi:MAG: KH domain-containing protein [Endomicrobium sp.]|jgi:predicted RNA-binding protein YlqC (UPF0109 family)|nr:KH domain-containing protein [Endomicrobium sp.]
MKNLVLLIAETLVDKPDQVDVCEVFGRRINVLELKVADEDRGKIIGKEGRIVKAVRVIVNSAFAKLDKRATVELVRVMK